tara:strand:+ start:185 stop:427 length:243 start_codon:yes stop_codon:yes gene_type:complete
MKNKINQIRKTIDNNIFLHLSVFGFTIGVGILIGCLPLILTLLFLSPGWLVLILPISIFTIITCGVFLPLEVMDWIEQWD